MLGQPYGGVQSKLFADNKLKQGNCAQPSLGSIAGPESRLTLRLRSVSGFSDLVRISNTS